METLRWAREHGCPWKAATRDRAAANLGYTDNYGNLQLYEGNSNLVKKSVDYFKEFAPST